jgi:hypothetical protein
MVRQERPKVNSEGQRELDKTQEQIDQFDNQLKSLTFDVMNQAPVKEVEQKISQEELNKHGEIYLKPFKVTGVGRDTKTGAVEKFNEKFRSAYDYQKEYVSFIAYNNMISGDLIEVWTKPFPGVSCEFWQIPSNKPVWGPRYLAEQLTRARHHVLSMKNSAENPFDGQNTYTDRVGSVQGSLIVKETIQRLDARPHKRQTSLFIDSKF